jgi:hypothetical protein
MNVFRQSLPALRRAAGAGRAGGVRHMSGHGTQEEAVAEMNRWRTISYGVVPLVFGLTAYTLSTASHSHGEEKIVRGLLRGAPAVEGDRNPYPRGANN